jgi:hypothetical protein
MREAYPGNIFEGQALRQLSRRQEGGDFIVVGSSSYGLLLFCSEE